MGAGGTSEELRGPHEVGGQARHHPCGQVVGPLAFIFCRYFSYFAKSCSVKFQVNWTPFDFPFFETLK